MKKVKIKLIPQITSEKISSVSELSNNNSSDL